MSSTEHTAPETTPRPERSPATRALLGLAARGVAFVVVFAALFFAALFATSQVRYRKHTLLQYLTHNLLEPGDRYHSLVRFREAEARGPVDVVFFGSSHAYRGFDPREFEGAGHSAQNLGSTNQTPLNSYYLAQRYLPSLAPKVVVVEVYYATLDNDGLEAFRDLAVNTGWSWPLMRMAFATRQLDAIEYGIAKGMGWTPDPSRATQADVLGEVYLPGGYVESVGERQRLESVAPLRVELRDSQLDYLCDLTEIARSHGARVVWVSHPLPSDHRASISNAGEVRAAIERAAARAQAPYWDYGDRLSLHPLADFADFHHLSARGAATFNEALLRDLTEAGLLDAP